MKPLAPRLHAGALALALLLGGCSMAPVYHEPAMPLKQDAWSSAWAEARPADAEPRGAWWQVFGDATLDGLQHRLDADSPSLAAALARYDQATAYTAQLRAAQLPSLDAAGAVTRNRQSDNRPLRGVGQPATYGANTVGLTLSYEIDVWGRVRDLVASGVADAQASAADVENVRLSLHATLADTYFALRGTDAQLRLLGDAVQAYTRALTLTENRHAGGIASGLDVARAQTQLGLVRAQLSQLQAQRAIYEHAIASLVGEPAMSFRLPPSDGDIAFPEIPVGLPSALLQRRPDIAAAERRVAAANARIGVARAAFFPTFAIAPSIGYQNTGGPEWLSAPNTFWSLGPLAFLNLFDGGLRQAQLDRAKAATEQAAAEYRGTVLNAYQQVEDEMSRLVSYRQAALDQAQAAESADRTLLLAFNRYREGAVNYLEVVTAQTAALDAQRALINLQTQRLLASVGLVRALGGGWHKDLLNPPAPAGGGQPTIAEAGQPAARP